jgi:hypothetical protein
LSPGRPLLYAPIEIFAAFEAIDVVKRAAGVWPAGEIDESADPHIIG